MYGKMKEFLAQELAGIEAAGLYKNERIITTPQRADIKVNGGEEVLNFCGRLQVRENFYKLDLRIKAGI